MEHHGSTRRVFLARVAGLYAAAALPLGSFALPPDKPRLITVKGGTPVGRVQKAVEALGGLGKFVGKGDVVLVKPNIGWERKPEFAANTNPEVVAEIVKLCLGAGAKKVKVFDRPCGNPQRCADLSGIKKAVEDAGAEFSFVNESRFVKKSTGGTALKEWEFYRDALEVDKIINIPIAKQHGLSGLTLCLKNWMGLIGGNRGQLHGRELAAKLADLAGVLKAQAVLHVVDATRILLRNGPTGGRTEDVKETNAIAFSADPIACEAWAAGLFDKKPSDVGTVVAGARAGLGIDDLSQVDLQSLEIGG